MQDITKDLCAKCERVAMLLVPKTLRLVEDQCIETTSTSTNTVETICLSTLLQDSSTAPSVMKPEAASLSLSGEQPRASDSTVTAVESRNSSVGLAA